MTEQRARLPVDAGPGRRADAFGRLARAAGGAVDYASTYLGDGVVMCYVKVWRHAERRRSGVAAPSLLFENAQNAARDSRRTCTGCCALQPLGVHMFLESADKGLTPHLCRGVGWEPEISSVFTRYVAHTRAFACTTTMAAHTCRDPYGVHRYLGFAHSYARQSPAFRED